MLGNPQYQRINLAELLEVRSVGLTASEVLTLLAASCDHLARASNRRGLFTAEQIFLTSEGKIEVKINQNYGIFSDFLGPTYSNYQSSKAINPA